MTNAINTFDLFISKVENARIYLSKAKEEQQAYINELYEADKSLFKTVDNYEIAKGQCLSLARAIVTHYDAAAKAIEAKGFGEDTQKAKLADNAKAKNNAMSKLRVYLSRAFEAANMNGEEKPDYKVGIKMATKDKGDRIVISRKIETKQKSVHDAVKELVEQYGASAVLEAVQSNADIVTAAKANAS